MAVIMGTAGADTLSSPDELNEYGEVMGDDVYGLGGNDTLYGGDGIDTASYAAATGAVRVSLATIAAQSTISAGNDTLSGIENLTGGAYDDQLTGDAGNNVLIGNAGDDILIGGVGSDTIIGGTGADTLTGGTQNDSFVYLAVGDSTLAATDRITDFAKGDILDVSAIDANSKVAGNQAFVQAAAFTHTAGQFTLAYDAGTNTTTALFDTDGDANADMAILFTGNVTALTGTWAL